MTHIADHKFAHPAAIHGHHGLGQFVLAAFTPVKSVLGRLFDTMMYSRQLQANREVARYVQSTGGRFTDSIERDISNILLGDGFNRRR